MQKIIRLELQKALKNKFFLFAIIIGVAVTMLAFFNNMEMHYQGIYDTLKFSEKFGVTYNPYAEMSILFNRWIGGEAFSLGSSIYFFIFPILIAIPYGWSYCLERKSGYEKNMVIRSGKTKYYFAKYIAVFVSGGLAMVIPMILNFLLTAMFVPAFTPDPYNDIYYGIFPNSLMSMLYYAKPFLYVFCYLLIDFIFCGLIACLSYAFGTFIKNHVAVVLLPFIVLVAWHYANGFFYNSGTLALKELSPMFFLRPMTLMWETSWLIIITEAVILFMFTFLMTVIRGRKYEIY